jgi:sirohydrochlorin ferrochelatase
VNQPSGSLNSTETNASPDSVPWGVILLCHGSQRGTSRQECSCSWRSLVTPLSSTENEEVWPGWCRNCPSTPQGLNDAATRLQSELGRPQAQVLLSCLEFIQPHPDQAVQLLVNQGLERVVVMPYLLGHGKHATLELDEVLDQLRAEIPQVLLYLADGLGADSRIAELVVERIHDLDGSALACATGHPIGVLVVKAGTKTQYDDCLWLEELGQMVEKGLGLGYAVAVAQSHYGDPTMEAAAARLVEERRVSSIICVPYLFFPGMILRRNVLGGLERLQQKYPGVPMTVTPPLGVDDRLVAVAADRVREVWELEADQLRQKL